MPDETQPLTPPPPPGLDDILAEYVAAEERGQVPDRQGLLSRYPQFAADLREFFANRDEMQRLAAPLRDAPEQGAVEGQRSSHPLLKIRYFGDYELLDEIAAGGMGVVYKARQVSLNRIVAVKMILKGTLASEDDVKRFQAEAEAAANLQHPAIVAIHEVGLHEGQHYFSMDYVDGQSLAQLPREQPLTARQAAEYVRDAAEAVHYAHQQGTLHRDLKPSNILIDRQGRVRITDFGLAKKLTGDSDLTLTGQVLGTPSYMPPEQALGKRSLIGAASDIYSLGAVLYELLTGRPPFRGESPVETLKQVETLDPVAPRLLNPATPRDLETICLKCLEKEPHKRYGTAQLLADDLDRFLHGEAVLARRPSPMYRFTKFARRNRTGLAITTLTVLFVVLLAGVVGWMVRDREAERTAFQQQMANDQAARLAKTAEDIQLALQEAQTLGERALALVNDNPSTWNATLAAAMAACKRAESLSRPNSAALDPELVHRVSALKQRLELDEQDRQFIAGVDAIRMEASQVDIVRNTFLTSGQSTQIKALFKRRGIEFGSTDPEQVARSICARPQAIQKHLLAALDVWLGEPAAERDDERSWLIAALAAADSDPWRTQVREALAAGTTAALENLIRDLEPSKHPVPLLLLIARHLPYQPRTARRALLQQIQSAYPGDFWANEDLGLLLMQPEMARWDEAVRFCTVAVALRPDNPGARLNLGCALLRAGDADGALVVYRDVLRLTPNYASAYDTLVNVLRSKGELDGASAVCRQAIERNPDSALAHNALANVLSNQGNLDDALAEFGEAIRLDALLARPHHGLANARWNMKDLNGAIVEFREAVRLDAKNAMFRVSLGKALWSQGDLDGAIAELREAISLDPHFDEAHAYLAHALRQKGDLDGSIAEYREAIDRVPEKSAAFWLSPAARINVSSLTPASITLIAAPDVKQGFALLQTATNAPTLDFVPRNPISVPFVATEDTGYRVVFKGLQEGARPFGDRTIKIETLPAVFAGLTLVQTKMGHKGIVDRRFAVVLSAPEQLLEFVSLDERAIDTYRRYGVPAWLQGFAPTGHKITTDDPGMKQVGAKYSVFVRPADAGPVVLGPPCLDVQWSTMYFAFFAAAPKSENATIEKESASPAVGLSQPSSAADVAAVEKSVANHLNLAEVLSAKSDLNGAIAEYREAIRLNPDHVQAHNNLALVLRSKGDVNGAVAEAREAVRLDPKYPWVHNTLGLALRDNGDLNGAIAAYREAIRLDPKIVNTHNNLGIALEAKRDLAGAMAEYREEIRVNPKFAWPHNNLGFLLQQKGDLDTAIAEFREAIRLDPKIVNPHSNLGSVLQRKGALDEAIAEFREAIRLDPKHVNAHHNLGLALKTQGDLDGAIAEYQSAIRLRPGYAAALVNLGAALYEKRNRDEAIATFRQAIAAQPNYYLAHDWLGFVLLVGGDIDSAIPCFQEALRLNPKSAKSHTNLGNALRKKGDRDGAIAAYRKALEVAPGFAEAEANLKTILAEDSGAKSTQKAPSKDE